MGVTSTLPDVSEQAEFDRKLTSFIESWIPINVKDAQHVKEAKVEARAEFISLVHSHIQVVIEDVIGKDEDLNAAAETYGKDDQSLGDNPFPNPNLQYVVRRATRNVLRTEQRQRAAEYLRNRFPVW